MGYGDIPRVINGSEAGYKEIFAYGSGKEAIVIPNVTLMAGFGVLEAGQALALNGSSAGNYGKVMPYDPTATADGATIAPARINLVQNGADTAYAYTVLNDAYKVAIGDYLYALDSNTTAQDLGAITAIDTTTYTHMAKLTLTSSLPSTILTSTYGYLVVKGYDACVGILARTVDTGTGSSAAGAVADMIIGHAVLYTGMLINVDSAARTDLSASTFGQYTYLR